MLNTGKAGAISQKTQPESGILRNIPGSCRGAPKTAEG